jgi:F0F1-type ATP synthase assembly protein I
MKNDFSDRLEQKLKKQKTNHYKNNGYSIGLKISLDLISSIVVGTLIGFGLDKIFSTKPVFFIIFLVLGIITGFYSLFKTVKKLN